MLEPFKYSGRRKSHQSFNEVYFWTSVIKDWKHLLKNDEMKMIIIESFQWLVKHELLSCTCPPGRKQRTAQLTAMDRLKIAGEIKNESRAIK